MGFVCATRTHVGHRRKLNEDAVLGRADCGIWAVADGMGGHEAGEVASAMIVDALASLPQEASLDRRLDHAVAALEAVNLSLINLGRHALGQRTVGSTVVGLLADGAEYRCFWAGDSRAYHLRGGAISQLTRDHSLVQTLLDAGMIGADEAEGHPNANVVTRAVGADDRLQVDTVGGALEAGDLFLLASDGLTRLVGVEELRGLIQPGDLDAAADALVALALDRGAPDNVSLALVRRD